MTEIEINEDYIRKVAQSVYNELQSLSGKENFKCPRCDKPIAEDVSKCPHCGVSLEWE